MLVLVTVSSTLVSGTAEAKSHSSSSFATLVLLCAKFEVGCGIAPSNRSTVADAGGVDFTDCWYWNGEPCRGVMERAANGSGERAGWNEG